MIGQNIEKSPGGLRRLAFTHTLVKDDQLTLVRKTLKELQELHNNNISNNKPNRFGLLARNSGPRKFYASHLLGENMVSVLTICQQMLISRTIPRGLSLLTNHVYSWILYVSVSYFRLLRNLQFHLCHHKTYIFYFAFNWFL